MGIKFVYGGLDSEAAGLTIVSAKPMDAATRDVTVLEIPGRNGQIIRDNGRYKNVTIEVEIAAKSVEIIKTFNAAISAKTGYNRLTFSWLTDEFRLAALDGGVEWDMLNSRAGIGTVRFNAKPQRFLTTGETTIILTAAGTISNPTAYPSKPLITVYGNEEAQLVVGDYTVDFERIGTATGTAASMTLNCEEQTAFYRTNNRSSLMSGEFPTLKPGGNAISFSGSITKVEINPRWYKI